MGMPKSKVKHPFYHQMLFCWDCPKDEAWRGSLNVALECIKNGHYVTITPFQRDQYDRPKDIVWV